MKNLIKYLKSENKLKKELSSKLIESEEIFHDILNVCDNKFDLGTGSYLFDGQKYEYYEGMFEKQLLLYEKVRGVSKVLEIGTYMSHSLLIMLLSNPNIEITCIDIDDKYSLPTTEYLKKRLNANITFIKGDSLKVLPRLTTKFDLFHIDGAHNIDFVKKEFELCKNLSSSKEMEVIFDDYDAISQIKSIISLNHEILEQIIPNCNWKNSYLKLKL